MAKSICLHEDFFGEIAVGRITDVEGGPVTSFMVDLRVKCTMCETPFKFVGVPPGLDLNGGAHVSIDGLMLSIRIAPDDGKLVLPVKGLRGFTVNKMF